MKENWFMLGVIHGNSAAIEYFYNQNKARLNLDDSINNIILLGDVGCNYSITGNSDSYLKSKLSKLPFHYICLRGNHEARVTDMVRREPWKWENLQKHNGIIYIEKDFPTIEYLEDISAIYEFAGYKTLSIPGAYSVDKFERLEHGWQWFSNEQLSKSEMAHGMELIKSEKAVDLVISHTCPITYEPKDLFIPSIDQSKVDKTMELYLEKIESQLIYKRWAWGHYHADRLYPWDNEKEKLMLFDENVVDLRKFMNMRRNDYLNDILA